jgi:hypothetical protein
VLKLRRKRVWLWIAAALAAYEDVRRPETREIVLANRRHGPPSRS